MMGGAASALVMFTAVIAALFALGSFAIVQDASTRVVRFWFGFLSVLIVFMIVIGALTLLTT